MEDGSEKSASDTGLPDEKVRFSAWLRQATQRAPPLLFWVRLLGALTILGLIVSRVDLKATSVPFGFRLVAAIAAGTGLWLLSQAVAALRWQLVLRDDVLPWSYLFRLYVIGTFFGLFLPTSVGGDAVRAAAAIRSSKRGGRAIASVLVDRGLGVMATVAYAGFGVVLAPGALAAVGERLNWQVPGLAMVSIGTLVAGALIFVLRRSANLQAVLADGIGVLGDLARSPRSLVRVFALAFISQGLLVLVWYALAQGMRFTLPASTFLWAVPLVTLSALLPITFAGLGVREGVWLILLATTAISAADIVAFSLLYFVCNLLVGIVGGILFVSQGLMVEASGRTSEQNVIDVE